MTGVLTLRPETLLRPTPQGLYCEPGDFYVDPVSPVDRAVITHGHADHARAGHGTVLATPETLAIMAARYGEEFTGQRQSLAYGETSSVAASKSPSRPPGMCWAQPRRWCAGAA